MVVGIRLKPFIWAFFVETFRSFVRIFVFRYVIIAEKRHKDSNVRSRENSLNGRKRTAPDDDVLIAHRLRLSTVIASLKCRAVTRVVLRLFFSFFA